MSGANQDLDLDLLHRARQGQEPARMTCSGNALPMGTAYCQTTAVGVAGLEFDDLLKTVCSALSMLSGNMIWNSRGSSSVPLPTSALSKVYNSLRRQTSGKHRL